MSQLKPEYKYFTKHIMLHIQISFQKNIDSPLEFNPPSSQVTKNKQENTDLYYRNPVYDKETNKGSIF
jgi:hypothetical protein